MNFESSFSLRITTHDIITSARMLECVANASDDVRHDVKFDPKESGERWIQITDDVAQEGDREDGDDTHDEFHPIGLGLQEQDTEETEEPQALQKQPPEKIEKNTHY